MGDFIFLLYVFEFSKYLKWDIEVRGNGAKPPDLDSGSAAHCHLLPLDAQFAFWRMATITLPTSKSYDH